MLRSCAVHSPAKPYSKRARAATGTSGSAVDSDRMKETAARKLASLKEAGESGEGSLSAAARPK